MHQLLLYIYDLDNFQVQYNTAIHNDICNAVWVKSKSELK